MTRFAFARLSLDNNQKNNNVSINIVNKQLKFIFLGTYIPVTVSWVPWLQDRNEAG